MSNSLLGVTALSGALTPFPGVFPLGVSPLGGGAEADFENDAGFENDAAADVDGPRGEKCFDFAVEKDESLSPTRPGVANLERGGGASKTDRQMTSLELEDFGGETTPMRRRGEEEEEAEEDEEEEFLIDFFTAFLASSNSRLRFRRDSSSLDLSSLVDFLGDDLLIDEGKPTKELLCRFLAVGVDVSGKGDLDLDFLIDVDVVSVVIVTVVMEIVVLVFSTFFSFFLETTSSSVLFFGAGVSLRLSCCDCDCESETKSLIVRSSTNESLTALR